MEAAPDAGYDTQRRRRRSHRRTGRRAGGPALRGADDVRPAARATRTSGLRRGRRRRPVRHRRHLPARRPVRPAHIRQASRLLRPYNPELDVAPFASQQVVDAGDFVVQPVRHRPPRSRQIEEQAARSSTAGARLITLGGDHTIAYPLLRAHHRQLRPGGTGALRRPPRHLGHLLRRTVTHGTPFRRAARRGCSSRATAPTWASAARSTHRRTCVDDAELGFTIVHCAAFEHRSVTDVVEQLRERIGDHPCTSRSTSTCWTRRTRPPPAPPRPVA